MGGSSVTKANGGIVLWDVDTQVDFMLPTGKLYVPGAEETAPAMGRLVDAAREAGIVHVASADDHELTDPEISAEPDFATPIRRTACAGRAAPRGSPRPSRPTPSVLPRAYPPGLVPRLVAEHREILLLKKNFNVFTNPNTEPLLDALDPAEIVVFGVATDVCDDAAIRGFLLRGRRVRFVEDAARGLDEDAGQGVYRGLARSRRPVHDGRRSRRLVLVTTASAPGCRLAALNAGRGPHPEPDRPDRADLVPARSCSGSSSTCSGAPSR